jgi:hypothetical protein
MTPAWSRKHHFFLRERMVRMWILKPPLFNTLKLGINTKEEKRQKTKRERWLANYATWHVQDVLKKVPSH